MSANHDIAITTQAIVQILRSAATSVPGATVAVGRPNRTTPGSTVWLTLYYVDETAARRTAPALPGRPERPTEQGRPMTVDLHYLVSFEGDEDELVPHRLLAATTAALLGVPVLTTARLRAAAETAHLSAGKPKTAWYTPQGSVQLLPHPLAMDELGRVWANLVGTRPLLATTWLARGVTIEPAPSL